MMRSMRPRIVTEPDRWANLLALIVSIGLTSCADNSGDRDSEESPRLQHAWVIQRCPFGPVTAQAGHRLVVLCPYPLAEEGGPHSLEPDEHPNAELSREVGFELFVVDEGRTTELGPITQDWKEPYPVLVAGSQYAAVSRVSRSEIGLLLVGSGGIAAEHWTDYPATISEQSLSEIAIAPTQDGWLMCVSTGSFTAETYCGEFAGEVDVQWHAVSQMEGYSVRELAVMDGQHLIWGFASVSGRERPDQWRIVKYDAATGQSEGHFEMPYERMYSYGVSNDHIVFIARAPGPYRNHSVVVDGSSTRNLGVVSPVGGHLQGEAGFALNGGVAFS